MVYEQTTQLKAVDLEDAAAITLVGTDVERIVTGFRSIHEVWAAPLDIAIAVYLLERQIFIACIVPAVIATCTTPPYISVQINLTMGSLYLGHYESFEVVKTTPKGVD